MSFEFNGVPVAGFNMRLHVPPPELLLRTQRYWGLYGATEIRGRPTDRIITLDFLLKDNYQTYTELAAMLDRLDLLVGEHGNLTIANSENGLNRYFGRATFLGFEPGVDVFSGPTRDDANTPPWGWWIRGLCRWHDVASLGNTA